jgi:predicted TIM-barrel fold metal-dependent hydrolase
MDFEIYLHYDVTAADLLALEDRAGIDMAVVMPQIEERCDNKRVAEAVAGEERLLGCACVNPNYVTAVDELKQAITEWGLSGLKLMAMRQNFFVASAVVDPLMGQARELGIPVTIHSGRTPCHPDEIGQVARRFPEVTLIMDHMGYPGATNAAIEVAKACPNVYLGTTRIAFEPEFVRAAVEAVGPERIVFGSNGPSIWPDLALECLKRLDLGSEAEALVFGENLAKIYGVA